MEHMLAAYRQRRQLSPRDGGFTLVELIAAMFVIGLILVLLIGVQLQAQSTIKDARLRQQATALANEAMEELRAIPWPILTRGMYSDFVSKSGDTRVVSNVLTIDGQSFPLVIASTGAQDLSQPWRPLFDNQGSNKQTRIDPGLTGTVFTVRSYVARPDGAAVDGVGLVVIVEWTDTKGLTKHTVVSAPAYASLGCGAADLSPFAGACQAILSSAASSGVVDVSVSAWNGDALNPQNTPLVPGSSFYSLAVHSAAVNAIADAVQTSQVTGTVVFGGSTASTDPLVEPVTLQALGNDQLILAASTGPQIPGAIPANPTPLSNVSAAAAAEAYQTFTGDGITIRGRSDFRRPATLKASTTASSCTTGVPANAACAYALLGNRNPDSFDEASSPLVLDLNGAVMYYAAKVPALGHNSESAFAARFGQTAGSSAVGCTSVAGAGCVSAGAERDMGFIRFGRLASGTWSGGASQLVEIADFRDSVLVQRGSAQKNNVATVTRTGTIRYWTGSSTATATFDKNSNFTVALGPATWTTSTPGYWVDMTGGSVSVSRAEEPAVVNDDPNCLTAACIVYASSGVITVTYNLVIHTPTNPAGYHHTVSAVINPVSATASFKDYQP